MIFLEDFQVACSTLSSGHCGSQLEQQGLTGECGNEIRLRRGQEKMNERFSGRKSKKEKSRTDFDYLDRVTDEEIDKAIKDDPDTLTLDDCDMTQLRVVYPKKAS